MTDRTPVISLGAGVQSSAITLMAARGDLDAAGIPTPRLAIFADPQDESDATYAYLDWLTAEVAGKVEIVRSTAGDLWGDVIDTAAGRRKRASNPPLFVRDADGNAQMIPRGCTRDYKIRPIRAALRNAGYGPHAPVTCYIGFTVDELERIKPSDVKWEDSRFPLIELGMTKHDCRLWFTRHGYPVPPSSVCVACPMQSDASWRTMQRERPQEFARAVAADAAIRTGLPGLKGDAYLHRSLQPLGDIDFRDAEDLGQFTLDLAQACGGGCFT